MSFIKAFFIASSILLPTTCFAKFNLKKILFLPAPHYPSDAVVKEVVKKPPFITASNQADMLYMLDYAVRAQEKQERRSDPVIAWMHRHTLKCIIGASSEDRKMLCPNRQERNQFFYISFRGCPIIHNLPKTK